MYKNFSVYKKKVIIVFNIFNCLKNLMEKVFIVYMFMFG